MREVVPVGLLEALAAQAPPEKGKTNGHLATSGPAGGFDHWVAGWIKRVSVDVLAEKPWKGAGRRWEIVCPFNPHHARGEAFIAVQPGGAIAAGCHHESCTWGWPELRRLVEPKDRHNGTQRLTDYGADNGLDEALAKERRRREVRRIVDEEEEAKTAADHPFLHRYSARELGALDLSFRWLVKGVLTEDTFGVLGGPEKSLKSYLAGLLAISVAGARRWLGEFWVPDPRPVVCYVGEGGLKPFVRRMRRMARSMGLTYEDLPIAVRAGAVPILSPLFQTALRHDLAELEPGLVWVDPFYAFQGNEANTSQLNESGTILNALSTPCVEAGAVLLLNAHFNQTGTGTNLRRLTGAGPAEWADSWLLVQRRQADVEAGRFDLAIDIGSRQWGGSCWDLTLDIGRFDPDIGDHEGNMTWAIERCKGERVQPDEPKAAQVRRHILDLLEEKPWQCTKEQTKADVGGSRKIFDDVWNGLLNTSQVVGASLPRREGSRIVKREVFAPSGTPLPSETLAAPTPAVSDCAAPELPRISEEEGR